MTAAQIVTRGSGQQLNALNLFKNFVLTDSGEDSKLVHRRKRPIVDALFSSLFLTRPSRKYSRPLLEVFACIG